MTLDLTTMLAGKAAYRAQLAALPIGEKLWLLDALRERTLVLRAAATAAQQGGAAPAPRAAIADELP